MSSAAGGSKPKPSSVSASTILADTARGSHVLKIDGYARTKAIATGRSLESVAFTVGGHSWCIRYYPNGRDRRTADYISLFLAFDESVDEPVRVQYALRFADVADEDDADGDAEEEREALESTKLVKYGSYDAYGYSRFIRRRALERSRHLRDDAFAVRCDMIVVDFVSDEVSATSVPVPPSNLQEHLRDLLEKQSGADVVFEVGGETVAAHRCMLAVRSPVFNAELFGEMKESSAGVVRIDDMEVAVFKALLYFIYTDTLPEI